MACVPRPNALVYRQKIKTEIYVLHGGAIHSNITHRGRWNRSPAVPNTASASVISSLHAIESVKLRLHTQQTKQEGNLQSRDRGTRQGWPSPLSPYSHRPVPRPSTAHYDNLCSFRGTHPNCETKQNKFVSSLVRRSHARRTRKTRTAIRIPKAEGQTVIGAELPDWSLYRVRA